MKKIGNSTAMILILSITLVIGGVAADAAQATGGGIQWLSYDEGRQRGEKENKKGLSIIWMV